MMTSGIPTGRYGVQMGTTCAVHKHDGWVPLEWHHIWPLGDGGPDVKANQVRVCANAHYSIHAVLDHFRVCDRNGVKPNWEFLKHFSPEIRAYAQRGYAQIKANP